MDLLQAQVDKTLGQSTRMQRDKEAVETELNKLKDKYDKAQVSRRVYVGFSKRCLQMWTQQHARCELRAHHAS